MTFKPRLLSMAILSSLALTAHTTQAEIKHLSRSINSPLPAFCRIDWSRFPAHSTSSMTPTLKIAALYPSMNNSAQFLA